MTIVIYKNTTPYYHLIFKTLPFILFSCDFSDFSDFSSAIKSIMIPHALLGDCIKCKQYYIARNWWHILKLFYLLNWNVKKKEHTSREVNNETSKLAYEDQ